MSNDRQPLATPSVTVTSPISRSPEFEDVDLYSPSATDVASIATSKDSLLNTTFLNTQANAQSAQWRLIEHQETVKSVLNSENANEVPFVHTSSSLSLPSLDPGSLQLSHNGAINTDAGSRSDSAMGKDLSSRRRSSTRQDSNSRRNSDTGREQTSKSSDLRQNSDAEKDFDLPESMHARSGLPRHLLDEQRAMYIGSPLNPANSHSRHHSSRGFPTSPINNPSSPYSGMDAYAPPQVFASPLPIQHYMMPPFDYSRIYSPNIPPNFHLPPDAMIPSAASPMYPSHIHMIPMIPPAVPTSPSRIPLSGSSSIVAAAAMTAEMKNMKSNTGSMAAPDTGSFADNNPYDLRNGPDGSMPDLQRPHSIPGPMPLPPGFRPIDPGQEYSYPHYPDEPNLQLPFYDLIPGPMPLPPHFQSMAPGQGYSYPYPDEPDLQRPHSTAGPMPLPGFQPMAPGQQYSYPYYPDEPPMGLAPSATFVPPSNVIQQNLGHESYDSRQRSHSRVDKPSQQSGGYANSLQRPKTPADVISAASDMPIPEKRSQSFSGSGSYGGSALRRDTMSPTRERTQSKSAGSFAEHNPYRLPLRKPTLDTFAGDESYGGSAPRRDTTSPTQERPKFKSAGSFAEHNPYRLPSRKPTLDTPAPPQLSSLPPRPFRRRSSSSSGENDYYGPDHSSRRSRRQEKWDSEKHRPSRSYHRSPSPEYRHPSRSRQRSHSLPFRYGMPITSVYPAVSYGSSSSSFDDMPPDSKYHKANNYQRRGFWSQFSNFFKSPFEHGRPATLHTPYPRGRTTEEPPVTLFFIITAIIGQAYFHALLRLPSLYFSRVSRIFDEANLSIYEIAEMVFETAGEPDLKDKSQTEMNMQVPELVAPKIRPQYKRLKNSWESFIDSLIREWETFNIVSVMLLTAILTILQINTAASDPVTRYAALFSLICALVSLLFGCMYIIRFGTMRKTYAAVEWAKSALDSSRSNIWNVWVLLSMPAVWLTWSIILFIVAIMSFVWRTNPANDNVSKFILSSTGLLIIRVALSAVLGLGLFNALLITNTFQLYGEVLDKDWRERIDEWKKLKAIEAPLNLLTSGSAPPGGYLNYHGQPLPHMTPLPPLGSFPPPPPPAPIISHAPYFPLAYPDSINQWAPRQRRPSSTRYPVSAYPESESSSTASSSESRAPPRRVRRHPSSSTELPQKTRPSSRDSPTRSNIDSRTPPIHDHDLPLNFKFDSPIPGPSAYSNPPRTDTVDAQKSNGIPDTNAPGHNVPFIPPLGSHNNEGHDPQSRVRFRSPLASAFGSSDWGADSSFDYPSPDIIGPSSSSASGITQESSNVQIQNSDALRRRRPT